MTKIETEVANSFNILSAYLITAATVSPPIDLKKNNKIKINKRKFQNILNYTCTNITIQTIEL